MPKYALYQKKRRKPLRNVMEVGLLLLIIELPINAIHHIKRSHENIEERRTNRFSETMLLATQIAGTNLGKNFYNGRCPGLHATPTTLGAKWLSGGLNDRRAGGQFATLG
ncbi:MAG: hypothetical protein QNJ61_10810 [Desulfobacterales bacterium]|nr:hypothetical protein [Desulfobacterales bacterium]